jgi:hypothetical protein
MAQSQGKLPGIPGMFDPFIIVITDTFHVVTFDHESRDETT